MTRIEDEILDLDEKDNLDVTKSDLIRWWEKRRLKYNLIVGGAGIFVFLLISAIYSSFIPDHTTLLEIFAYVALVSCVAYNILYTGGWICDLLVFAIAKKTFEEKVKTIFFWLGVVLSTLPFVALLLIVMEISQK